MEMRVSSPKPSLAPSDSVSDPEEKEVSDEDDDDRNHKHRRREDHSQSLERDVTEPVINRPFRKRNKSFGNRHSFRENESQPFEMIKGRHGFSSFPRAPFDRNQRPRSNQSFNGDIGAGRGRGRELGSWNQRDSRFSSIDVAPQIVPPGSIHSSLYTGSGLPNVSNAQNASWNAFGLISGVPNGGLDMPHPLGLPGTLRPLINSSINLSIPRQRCRDFEERGFCLRGDMCPMEHGVNRIVVEDVQSLSQFNLPVSLPSAHLMGAPAAGSGPLHSVSASTASMNGKGMHGKAGKSGIGDDDLVLGGAYPATGGTSGADFYDPDQPLWNDSSVETSNALLSLQTPRIDETELFSSDAPSDRHAVRLSNAPDRDLSMGTSRTFTSQSASSSVWGRIGGSKNGPDIKEKVNSRMGAFEYPDNQLKEDNDELNCFHSPSQQEKRIVSGDAGPTSVGPSLKAENDMRNFRKPSQRALRTLFVNGIPPKSNRRDALLSHFQKFGEVIDIHIPLNSFRAFVQFSKREEAEAALRAPDAVMGNRFIKLYWANRDNIPDGSISSSNGVTATDRGKYIHQTTSSKTVSDASPAPDHQKPVTANGPKTVPPSQKKLENLEQLKEELRKKQEMLDQKRNEFRRHLDKLAKQQALGLKGEVVAEPAAKRPKTGLADVKLASQLSDSGISVASPHAEITANKNNTLENPVSHSPKATAIIAQQESTALKPPFRPYAPVNRYKLDNRPTSFKIVPPLPAGLVNAAALKDHFSPYGEISALELEDVGDHDSSQSEARIRFTTRQAAERAFVNGKKWKDHTLKFIWMTPSNSRTDRKVSASNEHADTDDHPEEKDQVILETKEKDQVTQDTNISRDKESLESGVNSFLEHTDDQSEDHVMAEAIVLGDKEPSNSGNKNSPEHSEMGEDRRCIQVSSAEQPPEGNVC